MPVSSAPIRSPGRTATARVLRTIAPPTPANDDCDGFMGAEIVDAALRYFSLHGLGTVEAACAEVEAAWRRGDRHATVNWLAICRAFDRRLADSVEARLTQQRPTA